MKVLFPGTFDPFTKGHEHLVHRALAFCDQIFIALGQSSKPHLCPVATRVQLIQELYQHEPRIQVLSFEGLLVDTAKRLNVPCVLRGLRHSGDFNYEMPMAIANRALYPPLETLFLCTSPEYMYVSSSMIREILSQGGDIRTFVSGPIAEYYTQNT